MLCLGNAPLSLSSFFRWFSVYITFIIMIQKLKPQNKLSYTNISTNNITSGTIQINKHICTFLLCAYIFYLRIIKWITWTIHMTMIIKYNVCLSYYSFVLNVLYACTHSNKWESFGVLHSIRLIIFNFRDYRNGNFHCLNIFFPKCHMYRFFFFFLDSIPFYVCNLNWAWFSEKS